MGYEENQSYKEDKFYNTFFIVSAIILGLLTWGIITLFSEASSLLQDLNEYIEKYIICFKVF